MARQFNLIPPVCEQAEYHLFQREKVEVQLPELYHKIGKESLLSSCHIFDFPAVLLLLTYVDPFVFSLGAGVGAMTWSPLACGIITGKYENGIPESSRASMKVDTLIGRFWTFSCS